MLFSILFADYTNKGKGKDIRELETCINIELCKVVTWLNVDKTHCMLFTNGRKHRNRIKYIFINNNQTETVSHTNFLGVLIDKMLSWSCHIDISCTKIARGIRIIKKARYVIKKHL